jgi:precorrin-6Y C5,15-methyltransferase (decarboxylating)
MRWLSILGIGEDGVEGLSAAALAALGEAALVVGGARHLALAGAAIRGRSLAWPRPMAEGFAAILAARPQPVAVLASGDPSWFGVATPLLQLVPAGEVRCLPAPSCFSLACARLGWALQDVATISFCGRPLDAMAPLLQPGARVLALSADGATPGAVAAYLRGRGFGPTRMHVLQALGGPGERITTAAAAEGPPELVDPLNLVALEVAAGPGARVIPLAPGLDDDAYAHDGQLTRREVRAVTLAALAPRRGERLWDIGAGAGSIGIEWMLRHPANQAIGIERRADRAERARANAAALGVPGLRLVIGEAPAALDGLPAPDAVFVGGGGRDAACIAAGWAALRPGGRIVANAVTVETEAALLDARARLGGSLTRLSVERLDAVGSLHGFRPAMTVTQWCQVKS